MSTLRRRGASAALANREQYIRLLQDSLPELGARGVRCGALQGATRRLLPPAVQAGHISLPANWMASASRALQLALGDAVSKEALDGTDLFLCALIHPTFIAAGAGPAGKKRSLELRRSLAMPLEATMSGAAVLRVLQEVSGAHHSSASARERRLSDHADALAAGREARTRGTLPPRPHNQPLSLSMFLAPDELPSVITPAHLIEIPHAAGLETLLLYDRSFFPEAGADGVASEVLLSSVTALCGAIDLCQGPLAVAAFMDRMLPRVTRHPQ